MTRLFSSDVNFYIFGQNPDMKIIIAEDDELMLKTIQLRLRKDGHDVICCQNGLEALEQIEQLRPDLIISDIMMPFVTGLEIVGDG